MAEKKLKKCRVNKRRGHLTAWCFGLGEAMNQMFGRSQGIECINLVNTKTFENRRLPVFRGGKHKKRGLLLNFCPFCGTAMPNTPAPNRKATNDH